MTRWGPFKATRLFFSKPGHGGVYRKETWRETYARCGFPNATPDTVHIYPTPHLVCVGRRRRSRLALARMKQMR